MRHFISGAWAIYAKDMRLEMRTKETVTGALTFAVIVAFIFGFAFDPSPRIIAVVGPGIVWVAFVFTGVLSMNRAFAGERDRGTLEGLLLTPFPRVVLYVGKLATTTTIMLAVELVMLPLFLVLFDISLFNVWFGLTAFAATVGFAAAGTLFAAMAAHTKAREVLLPLLFLPISLPIIIAAVSSTGASLNGEGWDGVGRWLQFMIAFDVVFLVLSSWAFEFVLEE